mmetsp:Transcript_40631/g.91653  ORF Transcript_40631/g.91653 Transcript_40631/m.91653 type:complete len:137 (+) Transcript_40631:82-492(+)|eukprot:CAMPEP_0197941502 /NCGR_PEP_ID=MMETSP1439-20131203/122894_1 /TAXON_ID=66791 /ORGANISM="Gonyaulax spinifera, Strain CCMP409" /LENGTH=136 /DNA_ID=CAMNT_0043564707 /DNA_START=67 /DNA_END=477 /DNA_ORIENTATION=+
MAAAALTDEELVGLVQRMTDDRFLSFIEDFVEENSQYFEHAAAFGEGHKLFQTEVHQQYQRLFESRVEAWLRERGCGYESFIAAIAGGGSEGLAADVVQELLAVADFEQFVSMMRAHRSRLELEAAVGRKAAAGRE